jgi:hypothetical protein
MLSSVERECGRLESRGLTMELFSREKGGRSSPGPREREPLSPNAQALRVRESEREREREERGRRERGNDHRFVGSTCDEDIG